MNVTLNRLLSGTFVADRLTAAGMSLTEAVAKAKRFAGIAGQLLERGHASDTSAVSVFVPGRIEVFGKHTDYCGGRSLLCTVERGLCFVAIPRDDSRVRFAALDLQDSIEVDLAVPPKTNDGHWSNYPINVIRRLSRNFPTARRGADIAMSGDLPKASGLSSSSAMIVGTFMALASVNALPDQEIYRRYIGGNEALAGYLGTVENGQSFGPLAGDKGVGTFGGSQDHTAILCCAPDKLSLFSFCPVVSGGEVDVPADVHFVIADSGVSAEKTGAAQAQYNRVSGRARELVEVWHEIGRRGQYVNDIVNGGDEALRALRQQLKRYRPDTADDLMSRLDQFLIESNSLIPKAADAFATGDWASLRWIADESQARAEANLHNQVPQTIALQRTLIANGAKAASAFGAGFGGSVWGLFDSPGLAAWKASDAARSHSYFVTRPGCPALELNTAAE